MRCELLFRNSFGLGIVASALTLASGCQTVNSELAMLFGDAPSAQVAEQAEAAAADAPKFYIELRESGNKPQLAKLPLPDVLYIQQALDQSGATRQFRRMKVELYRQLPGGGGHMLPVEFDHANRRVPPGKDYAIHPNDRLVITEDTSTVLDDMLGNLGVK
jgi:hypothetical protein